MGTSTNQSSPNTPGWRPVKAILASTEWSVERQSLEIWRAALNDRQGRLQLELSDPLVANAGVIAEERVNPAQAMRAFDQTAVESYSAGLILDMAKRALVRASAARSGAEGFASELFAEAASYFASRDLPSYVGRPGRIQTSTGAIAFKNQIREIARQTALSASRVRTDIGGWQAYVSETLSSLQNGRAQ